MTDPHEFYDNGWDDALDDGHQFAENWLGDPAAAGIHGPYSYVRPSINREYFGKNEPEDPYFA